jgi:ATP-dependent protease Clp ATPase subunit
MLKFAKNFQRLAQSTTIFQVRCFSEVPIKPEPVDEISSDMTPKKIVQYLNKYIIGQEDAKRAMAIALSNNYFVSS